MKKIALINQDSGYLMIDIANNFLAKGYRTSLIAGRVVERDNPLNKNIELVKIRRYNRTSNLHKFFSWIIGTFQILFLILTKFRKYELLIVSNPPFAPLLPLLVKNRYSIFIFDLYPDAIVEYGIARRNSWFIKSWEALNKKVFKKAFHIYTLTDGMKRGLERYITAERIEIVPLWSSTSFLKPIDKDKNSFIKAHGLEGKFVILYSGNFGVAHQIDLLIKLASKITDPRIIMVLIGGGPTENALKQTIVDQGISNCIMLPWQDVNTLPFSLAASDLSIVTLSDNASQVAIPSKLFSYMAVGSPVLGIAGKESDLEKLIHKYDIGKSFTSDQFKDILFFIESVAKDPDRCKTYQGNSLNALKYHTISNVDLLTRNYV